jgi:hypothetical protein
MGGSGGGETTGTDGITSNTASGSGSGLSDKQNAPDNTRIKSICKGC